MSVRLLAAAALLLALARPPAVAGARVEEPAPVETFDAAWTIIRDSHFDRTMNGVDWNAVREELRPRAAAARNPGELRAVLRDMLGRLGQSHFAVIPGGAAETARDTMDLSGDPGVDVRLIDNALLVSSVESGSAASLAGIKPGWKVVAIADRRLDKVLPDLPGEARLRNVEAWRVAHEHMRGPSGSTVTATFSDANGHVHDLTLERRPETGLPVTVGHLPTMFVRVQSERRPIAGGLSAGVIRFNVWMAAVDREFQQAVDAHRNADGIVVDLRGNPGGLAAMLMGISGHFLTERVALGTMKTRDTELRFVANPRRVSATGERVEPFGGPLAILVDAMSGSASECFTGGMQAIKRARVFGQTSMGQALPALFSKLPNGDVLLHAYGDFVAADGTRLEGRGVVPDEIVPLTRESLLSGRDDTLEAALAWIGRSAGKR